MRTVLAWIFLVVGALVLFGTIFLARFNLIAALPGERWLHIVSVAGAGFLMMVVGLFVIPPDSNSRNSG